MLHRYSYFRWYYYLAFLLSTFTSFAQLLPTPAALEDLYRESNVTNLSLLEVYFNAINERAELVGLPTENIVFEETILTGKVTNITVVIDGGGNPTNIETITPQYQDLELTNHFGLFVTNGVTLFPTLRRKHLDQLDTALFSLMDFFVPPTLAGTNGSFNEYLQAPTGSNFLWLFDFSASSSRWVDASPKYDRVLPVGKEIWFEELEGLGVGISTTIVQVLPEVLTNSVARFGWEVGDISTYSLFQNEVTNQQNIFRYNEFKSDTDIAGTLLAQAHYAYTSIAFEVSGATNNLLLNGVFTRQADCIGFFPIPLEYWENPSGVILVPTDHTLQIGGTLDTNFICAQVGAEYLATLGTEDLGKITILKNILPAVGEDSAFITVTNFQLGWRTKVDYPPFTREDVGRIKLYLTNAFPRAIMFTALPITPSWVLQGSVNIINADDIPVDSTGVQGDTLTNVTEAGVGNKLLANMWHSITSFTVTGNAAIGDVLSIVYNAPASVYGDFPLLIKKENFNERFTALDQIRWSVRGENIAVIISNTYEQILPSSFSRLEQQTVNDTCIPANTVTIVGTNVIDFCTTPFTRTNFTENQLITFAQSHLVEWVNLDHNNTRQITYPIPGCQQTINYITDADSREERGQDIHYAGPSLVNVENISTSFSAGVELYITWGVDAFTLDGFTSSFPVITGWVDPTRPLCPLDFVFGGGDISQDLSFNSGNFNVQTNQHVYGPKLWGGYGMGNEAYKSSKDQYITSFFRYPEMVGFKPRTIDTISLTLTTQPSYDQNFTEIYNISDGSTCNRTVPPNLTESGNAEIRNCVKVRHPINIRFGVFGLDGGQAHQTVFKWDQGTDPLNYLYP